ncbi:hypothetical protein HT031_004488 [Scenedesmus sp. PABB004]|nr:hypothetical protein HT031_004488 [Scenedesmus sp. PABB004]
MPDVQEAAEAATFWVSFGQAASLVGATMAATAIGAALVSKAMDNIDEAAYQDMQAGGQRRTRLTLEEAERLAAQQQQEQQQQQQQGQQGPAGKQQQ